jgi:uncharacterized membrane protein
MTTTFLPEATHAHDRRPFFLRSEIDRLLTISMLFSCTLVAIRVFRSHSISFIFMPWNLFLAYCPYAITTWLTRRQPRQLLIEPYPLESTAPGSWSSRTKPAGGFAPAPGGLRPPARRPFSHPQILVYLLFPAWLLLIPNSFYILTDLFHLTDYQHPRIPQWFDLALIFSFAWNGLLLGVLSCRQMEKMLLPHANTLSRSFFVYPIMLLSALGVYAGRYLRYNSWDILSDPFQLVADIIRMIIHPFRNQYAWDMIFCYAILLSFIYLMLKKVSRALA